MIAIEINREVCRLRDDVLVEAFEADAPAGQQTALLQRFTNTLQELVTQRGHLMDSVNIATILHHLSEVITHGQAQPAAVSQTQYRG